MSPRSSWWSERMGFFPLELGDMGPKTTSGAFMHTTRQRSLSFARAVGTGVAPCARALSRPRPFWRGLSDSTAQRKLV